MHSDLAMSRLHPFVSPGQLSPPSLHSLNGLHWCSGDGSLWTSSEVETFLTFPFTFRVSVFGNWYYRKSACLPNTKERQPMFL